MSEYQQSSTPPKKEVIAEANWVFLKDLLPLDFWLGSQYRGNYNDRLQINLAAVENICRAGNSPPIILRSDSWNPPAVHTPDVVAPGLSALKKAAFQKDPGAPEVDKENYRLSTTDQKIMFKDKIIPVGWIIHMKDRKIMYEYEYKHHGVAQEVKEKHFIIEMSEALRDAIGDISWNESIAIRLLDKPDQYKTVGWKVFQQIAASLPGSLVSFKNLEAFIISELTSTSIWQALYKSTGIFININAQEEAKRRLEIKKYFPDGDHRRASYAWRKDMFPRQEEQEYLRMNHIKRFLTAIIPGGLLFEDLYLTAAAMMKYKQPLFRLSPKL